MNIKTIASIIAISSATLFGGAAYAQTMLGSQTVLEADLPAVQERCNQLNLASTTESLTDDSMGDDGTAGEADATIENAENVNEIANSTTTIDLDNVTLEQCKEAGLISAM